MVFAVIGDRQSSARKNCSSRSSKTTILIFDRRHLIPGDLSSHCDIMMLCCLHQMAKEPILKLKAGDAAPDFSAATNLSDKISLSDYRGKNVILYFYPRDDTPGCTKEACSFRDDFSAFKKRGAVILGVSVDSEKSHKKFVEKYKLPFELVSDLDKKIVQAYGVWGEKIFMGVKYQGIHRVTFLIGPDGTIKKIWPKVKPAEHAAEVLAALADG
jgi:peroxiredoxin Q/BCP